MTQSDTAGAGRTAPDRGARGGLSVALVGPDGAGKSTIAREVARRLPMPASYLYMGVNLEASTRMLPTTRFALALKRRRGGASDMTARRVGPATRRGPVADARALVRMLNWLAEEAYRQLLAGRIRRRGQIAVLDRDFFCDYHASAIAPSTTRRPVDVRLHGLVLRRWYRRPDLTIVLDAPAEVLLARKGEDTLEGLSRRRQEYLDLANVLPAVVTVDANRPLDLVTDDVVATILDFVGEPSAVGAPVRPAAGAGHIASTDGPAIEPAGAVAGSALQLDDHPFSVSS
jgi:thymidylate kinase